jgi:hypothetical protein
VLEIRQRPDGTIFSRILTDEVKTDLKKQDFDGADNTKDIAVPEVSFEESLASIQRAAAELVQLQQTYKENGRLSDAQKKKYSESLEKLGISAQKLANVQDDDDYRLLFEGEVKGSRGVETHRFLLSIQSHKAIALRGDPRRSPTTSSSRLTQPKNRQARARKRNAAKKKKSSPRKVVIHQPSQRLRQRHRAQRQRSLSWCQAATTQWQFRALTRTRNRRWQRRSLVS